MSSADVSRAQHAVLWDVDGLSLPGVQKFLSIAAEAQRVIDRRERLQAVAEKVA